MLRALAVVGIAVFLTSAGGSPTAVAEPAVAEPTWTMPSLKGLSLPEARALYTEAISDHGGPKLKVDNEHHKGWTITAPKMWDVCWQAPAAGTEFTAETWVGIGVDKRRQC